MATIFLKHYEWKLFTQFLPNYKVKNIPLYRERLEILTWKQYLQLSMWRPCELESRFCKLFVRKSIRNLSREPTPSHPNPTEYYSSCLHGDFQIKRGWLLNVVFRDEMAFGGWGIGVGGFVCLGPVIHMERAATQREEERWWRGQTQTT